ncbi:hypothetical protein GGI21_001243 [Coemansia aciculifera]|nr:hypothetical protein GGI21_001243 [Coemansia aciculifera]
MNHAFTNGDVLGAHRSFGDLYGGPAVPPSPLSNMTMAACASAMQVDSEDTNDSAGDDDDDTSATCSLGAQYVNAGVSASALASHTAGINIPVAPLLPNEVHELTNKPFGGFVGGEGVNMSNADIVIAIFNAMSNAAATASNTIDDMGLSLAAVQNSTDSRVAAMLDPTSFGYDPGAFTLAHNNNGNSSNAAKSQAGSGPHAMDWCFDWSHAAPCGPSGSAPDFISTTASSGLGAGKDDRDMRVDWTSSGASTAVGDSACPGTLAFGAAARSATQN